MTLRKYLLFMGVATIICWSACVYLLFTIDPFITNTIGFFLFYVSLFLSLTGTAALVGFIIRFIALKQELAFRLVKEAFRQSFLFAALIVVSLILQSHGLFSWLNLLLLVISLSVLEFFLISYDKNKI